ncbi:forkhead box protein D1-like [Anguilla anguilla]|uniref:forkhead box protein D1-like n=1 Tax=Anguilla anguilla TaxID=7936 RepID=UPI0015ACCD72|nr:forkhead box protein D1-like [Anguilla anguilla]
MDADAAWAGPESTRAQNGRRGPPSPRPGDAAQEGGGAGGVSGKPPLSYIAMIAQVILASPAQKLNLAAIYADVEARFPYYRGRGQGWKNSVRHNLSLNGCFVKLGRCEDGKGSYWGIHPAHRGRFLRGDFRQHRKASRSRRKRGIPEGDGGGDLTCWGAPPCPGPCPQCPFQLQWAPRTLPPHPGPVSWSPGALGDAGRWGYGWFPWRPPGWGAGNAALGGVEGLCSSLCVRPPPPPPNLCSWQWAAPDFRDRGYPWTCITGPAYPI